MAGIKQLDQALGLGKPSDSTVSAWGALDQPKAEEVPTLHEPTGLEGMSIDPSTAADEIQRSHVQGVPTGMSSPSPYQWDVRSLTDEITINANEAQRNLYSNPKLKEWMRKSNYHESVLRGESEAHWGWTKSLLRLGYDLQIGGLQSELMRYNTWEAEGLGSPDEKKEIAAGRKAIEKRLSEIGGKETDYGRYGLGEHDFLDSAAEFLGQKFVMSGRMLVGGANEVYNVMQDSLAAWMFNISGSRPPLDPQHLTEYMDGVNYEKVRRRSAGPLRPGDVADIDNPPLSETPLGPLARVLAESPYNMMGEEIQEARAAGVDTRVIRQAARDYGLGWGAVEVAADALVIIPLIGGLSKLATASTRLALGMGPRLARVAVAGQRMALTKPWLVKGVIKAGATGVAGSFAEGATEYGENRSINMAVGSAMALERGASDEDAYIAGLRYANSPEKLDENWTAFKDTVKAMLLLGGLGAGSRYMGIRADMRNSQKMVEHLETLAPVGKTKAAQASPEVIESAVDAAHKGTPAETVRISASNFSKAVSAAGHDPASVAAVLFNDGGKSLTEATTSGALLEIPAGKFSTVLGPSGIGIRMSKDALFRGNKMSHNQAKAMFSEIQKKMDEGEDVDLSGIDDEQGTSELFTIAQKSDNVDAAVQAATKGIENIYSFNDPDARKRAARDARAKIEERMSRLVAEDADLVVKLDEARRSLNKAIVDGDQLLVEEGIAAEKRLSREIAGVQKAMLARNEMWAKLSHTIGDISPSATVVQDKIHAMLIAGGSSQATATGQAFLAAKFVQQASNVTGVSPEQLWDDHGLAGYSERPLGEDPKDLSHIRGMAERRGKSEQEATVIAGEMTSGSRTMGYANALFTQTIEKVIRVFRTNQRSQATMDTIMDKEGRALEVLKERGRTQDADKLSKAMDAVKEAHVERRDAKRQAQDRARSAAHEMGHFYHSFIQDLAIKYPRYKIAFASEIAVFERILGKPIETRWSEIDTNKKEQLANAFVQWLATGELEDARNVILFEQIRASIAVAWTWYWSRHAEEESGNVSNDYSVATDVDKAFSKLFGVSDSDLVRSDVTAMDAAITEGELTVGGSPIFAADAELMANFEEELSDIVQPGEESKLALALVSTGKFDEKDAREYARLITEDRAAARKAGANEIASKQHRRALREWEVKYDEEYSIAIDEMAGDQRYYSVARLQKNKLPNGDPLTGALPELKLPLTEIENDPRYGVEVARQLDSLPGGRMTSRTRARFTLEQVATQLKYKDVPTMMNDLVAARGVEQEAAARAEAATIAKYGPPISREDILDQVMRSLHTDARAKRLRWEIEHLAGEKFAQFRKLSKVMALSLPSQDQITEAAHALIMDSKVGEIRPVKYLSAERSAARDAQQAYWRGDIEEAINHKIRELVAHEHYRESVRIKDEIKIAVSEMSRLKRPAAQTRLGRAGMEIQEQVNSVLYQFGMKTRRAGQKLDDDGKVVASTSEQPSEYTAQKTSPRDVFVQRVRSEIGIPIPGVDAIGTESTTVKNAKASQILAAKAFLTTLSRVASASNQVASLSKRAAIRQIVDDLRSYGLEYHRGGHGELESAEGPSTPWQKAKHGAARFVAAHTKMEFLFTWLDAGKANGPFWSTLFRPFVEAEEQESLMHRDVVKNINEIFAPYKDSRFHDERVYINKRVKSLTREQIFAVVLNQGNEHNASALIGSKRRRWSESDVEDILSHSTKQDWETAQKVWDYLDTFWEKSSDLQRRMTGSVVEKVEGRKISNEHGEFRGGYYPLSFNQGISMKLWASSTDTLEDIYGTSSTMAMTRHGHLEARNKSAGMEVSLRLSVLSNHLSNVVHDLTHREKVVDAWKLVNNDEFFAMFTDLAGDAMYRELNPWLMAIAKNSRVDPNDILTKILSKIRGAITVVSLGINMATGATQLSGIAIATRELGAVYMGIGVREVFGQGINPKVALDAASDMSALMRDRIATGADRDVADSLKRYGLTQDEMHAAFVRLPGYSTEMQQTFMKFIGVSQMAVDLPTWWGAYRKAMDGNVDGVAGSNSKEASMYADKVVRLTQGAPGAKDLAAVQRGHELLKIFSMFYGYFSMLINQIGYTATSATWRGDRAKSLARIIPAMGLLFVPAVLDKVIRDDMPEGDDEDRLKRWGLTLAKYPFSGIVLGRDIADAVEYKVLYGQWTARNPVAEGIVSVGQAAWMAAAGAAKVAGSDVKISRRDVRGAVRGIGVITGTPTNQIFKTADYLVKYFNSDEQVDIGEFLRGIAYGRKAARK